MPLLRLERAEFAAVLGRPIVFDDESDSDPHRRAGVWDVVVDASAPHASLRSDAEARRLVLTIAAPTDLVDGINLLHSLAYSPDACVTDTEAPTYDAAFERIRDEVANIYPSMALRGLDWVAITRRYDYVRELAGPEFWSHAALWIAELGDAHTQLVGAGPRFHPPYVAAMDDDGATLLRVPVDTAAWGAGVRPGDRLAVDDPVWWLRRTGASPQHRAMVAGRRFLAMTAPVRGFTAIGGDGARVEWTEERRVQPGLCADGNVVTLTRIDADLPRMLRRALSRAAPASPLVLDLRGNVGGSLVAAAEARRLLVRDSGVFGTAAFTDGRGTLVDPVTLTTAPDPDAWPGDVRVLVDAMTYSAAEDLLHPLVGAPHVTIEGGPTGGGSGRPHGRLIKDGVRLLVSTAITYTRSGDPIEYVGIGR